MKDGEVVRKIERKEGQVRRRMTGRKEGEGWIGMRERSSEED
jgi:hypothetical protein